MVSLTTQNSHSGQGFFGFSEDHLGNFSTNSDDDLIVDDIEIVSSAQVLYKPIRTTWVIVFDMILYVCLCLSAFLLPYFCDGTKCGEEAIAMIMYIHGGIWFTLFGLDRYIVAKHNESRLNGYLQFYRKTKNVRHLPFLINSCANAVVVIIVKGLDHHFDPSKTILYTQILVAVESALAFIFLIIYLVFTVGFNLSKALPDVTQEEIMTSFVNTHSYSEVGYKNENYIDQVMEKQADMIRYLRQHSETLARRNLLLQEELNKIKASRMERNQLKL